MVRNRKNQRGHIFLMASARQMRGFDLILNDRLEGGITELSQAREQFEELGRKGWIIVSDRSEISKCYGTLADHQKSIERGDEAKNAYLKAMFWALKGAKISLAANSFSHFQFVGRLPKKLGDTENDDKNARTMSNLLRSLAT